MSRYNYAGPFKNPTEGWYAKEVGDHFEIWMRFDRQPDGSAEPDRKHKSAPVFDESAEADEWICGVRDAFEEDYDEYLDENHAEISRMEAYEAYRNEY